MPIRTNFAICTNLQHHPLPIAGEDWQRLLEAVKNTGLRQGKIFPRYAKDAVVLEVRAPIVIEAINEAFWQVIGEIVKKTGEPWWDFCATVVDSKPQGRHPHAHALSLYRVTAAGQLKILHLEAF